MKTLRLIMAVAVMCCFVASLSYAGDVDAKGACKADIEKFCKDVKPGHGRIARCIKKHEAELSPACKESIAEAKEELKECAKACKSDVEKFCKDVKPGQGRIVKCLRQHKAELSADCGKCFKK